MINISTRYVNPDPDSTRDPRHVEARGAHRLRHQEGDRRLDALLLVGELRADLSRAEAPPEGRAGPVEAGAARPGQAHGVRAGPGRRRGATRVAGRQRERHLRDPGREPPPALLLRCALAGGCAREPPDAAAALRARARAVPNRDRSRGPRRARAGPRVPVSRAPLWAR